MANNLTQWKPQVTIDGKTTICTTYKELKRSLYGLLKESDSNQARVNRSRRGKWGEWFEYWSIIDDVPKITKQGWM